MQTVTKPKAKDHESYGSYTALAVLFPLIGLILGVVYMSKDDALDKKFGEHLLAVSIFASIAWAIAWYVFVGMQTPAIYTAPSY